MLSAAEIKRIELILERGERVELVPTRNGARIFEVRRREDKNPDSKK